jgi:DnaJ-class molecular chaperone
MQTPFKILGVPETASDADIKKAYKKLSMKHHPDKGGDDTIFQEISTAYATIKNANARQEYHQSNRGSGYIHAHSGNFHDMFTQPFSYRRVSVQAVLVVTLQELASNEKKLIQLQNGVTAEIVIPPTINDGDAIKYPQPNDVDLIVKFKIHPDPMWERKGLNLTTKVNIDFWDLILGTSISVYDIYEQELNVSISPKSAPGTILRLKEHGLQSQHTTGDMFVLLQPELPADIPESIITEIRKIKTK